MRTRQGLIGFETKEERTATKRVRLKTKWIEDVIRNVYFRIYKPNEFVPHPELLQYNIPTIDISTVYGREQVRHILSIEYEKLPIQ